MVTMVKLQPGEWTRIPETRCEVRWEGDETITVYRHGGIWDLSPAARPGQVMWVRITRDGRPVTPAWPVVALSGQRNRIYPMVD